MGQSKATQKVFLSYMAEDKVFAREIYRALTEAGLDVWFDELSLIPGTRWDVALKSELQEADVILLIIGPAPLSQWQKVEIASALQKEWKNNAFR